ncbi:hypothetical protein JM16_009814 [Phytophthora kernoviae]|uniref:Uncharacterized protein n=1 Tax=Phytophthora kernoviae TaxID=325452 RepID=A0A8T0LH30_9STRA|nr:hypothetical protein JM16_009814 [Phytophthora kernoviae]
MSKTTMITRGAPASPNAPSSPTSRADIAPSDSELPSANQEVVDVTGAEEPWADTAARRTSDPPPLRSTRRPSVKAAAGAALAEACRGKKKATKHVSDPAAGAATKKKAASDADRGSESDGETKPAPPASKKTRKAVPSAKTLTTEAIPATKSLPKPRPDRGFDLGKFMSTFEPGLAGAECGSAIATSGATAVPSEPAPTNMIAELWALKGEIIGFCEALRAIAYRSSAWTMALVSVLSQEKAEDISEKPSRGRHDSARSTAIPESIRRLIPVNRKGQEPCLRNVAGFSCSGGTYKRCGNSRRVHNWNEHLLSRLQELIDTTYDMRATNGRECR